MIFEFYKIHKQMEFMSDFILLSIFNNLPILSKNIDYNILLK